MFRPSTIIRELALNLAKVIFMLKHKYIYQQQESSTTKTVHKVINKGLKTYV